MSNYVGITVVAFSNVETVRTCLRSLKEQKVSNGTKIDITILINDSRRVPIDSLEKEFPEFRFEVLRTNIGYAGAIRKTWLKSTQDIIIVTNDDLIFRENWLCEILKPFGDEKVFAVTSSIINIGEEEEESNGALNPLGVRIPDIFNDRQKVLYPSGAAFAFRRDNVEPVDASYFLYYEDVYLGLLARLRGYQVVMNPLSKADHMNRLSTSKIPSAYLHYLQERNRISNIFIFFSGLTIFKLIPYFAFDLIFRIFQMLLFKRRPDGILRAWVYHLTHVGTTLSKRYVISRQRRVKDSDILPFMSGKVLPDTNPFNRFLNFIFLLYARIVRLNFHEIVSK